MNPADSFFSCLKQDESQRCVPPPPPSQAAAAPKPEENAALKLKALEEQVAKLEECSAAAASALRESKAEAQAWKSEARQSAQRTGELEGKLSELTKRLDSASVAPVETLDTGKALAGLRSELSSCSRRLVSAEEALSRLETEGLGAVSVSMRLLEGRLKSLEGGFTGEMHARFSELGTQSAEIRRQAGLAMETAAGGARRLDKLEENSVRLPYLEHRLAVIESKLERLYDLDSLAQSLKAVVEGMEERMALAMNEHAAISGGQSKLSSDFDLLSTQVRHMTALFNQFRNELAFLIPKKQPNNIGS